MPVLSTNTASMPTPILREVDLLVLSLLLKRPRHGYALMKDLSHHLSEPVSSSRVYYALRKLHTLGLVEKHQHSHPDRPTSYTYTVGKRSRAAVIKYIRKAVNEAATETDSLHTRYSELQRLQTILETMSLTLARAFGSQFRKQ